MCVIDPGLAVGRWRVFVGVDPPMHAETPQWGAADAEIKVPSGENTELKRSPFKA